MDWQARTRLVPRPGFMLIELLMSLAILGVLAILAAPVAQVEIQRAREQDLRRALREIRVALDEYKRAADEGRIAKRPGDSGYPRDLDVLVKGIEDQRDAKRAKIYFLRRIPRDPMYTETALADEGALIIKFWLHLSKDASDATDPQEGADIYDVYSLSNKVGLNGVPYSKW